MADGSLRGLFQVLAIVLSVEQLSGSQQSFPGGLYCLHQFPVVVLSTVQVKSKPVCHHSILMRPVCSSSFLEVSHSAQSNSGTSVTSSGVTSEKHIEPQRRH